MSSYLTMHHLRLLSVSLLALTTGQLLAESLPEDVSIAFDEQFVSIATGGEQQLSRAPAVATVITAKDIKEMGAHTLDQVLETVPGLHVSLSSLRASPIYSIRGINTDLNPHVLMLINGVPITQLWQGDRGPLSTLPISNIERVEIIRGPGSAVYGSDAFAGVINVITRSPSSLGGTNVSGTLGSFGTRQASLTHGNDENHIKFSFMMDYSESDGDNDRIIEEDAQSLWDDLFATDASIAPDPMSTRNKRLDTRLDAYWNDWTFRVWNWRQTDLGVGPGLAQALDPNGRGDVSNWLFDLSHDEEIDEEFYLETHLSYMDINSTSEQTLFPSGALLPIGSDGNINTNAPAGFVSFPDGMIGNPAIYEQHHRADMALFWTGMNDHRWRFATGIFHANLHGEETKNYGPGTGVDGTQPVVDGTLTDLTGTDFIYAPDKSRTVYYLSVQDEWYFRPDWDLTAGLRYDNYSDFGGTFNPRLALVWHPNYNLSTKLLYGRAFRAPSFQELYVQHNPIKLGNEDLDPETIQTTELVFDYQPTFDVKTTLSLYAYIIHDLIEYISVGGSVPQAQNSGQQSGRGFELELSWLATNNLRLTGNYSLARSRDEENNASAANHPQQQIYIRSDWNFVSSWYLNFQSNWVMDRDRAFNDPRPEIDDYTLVDVGLRYINPIFPWDASIKILNLFDENAKEPSPAEVLLFVPNDYPLPGRAYYFSMNYRF